VRIYYDESKRNFWRDSKGETEIRPSNHLRGISTSVQARPKDLESKDLESAQLPTDSSSLRNQVPNDCEIKAWKLILQPPTNAEGVLRRKMREQEGAARIKTFPEEKMLDKGKRS
jgi:hypothetical protein